jgi:hypothetical protein
MRNFEIALTKMGRSGNDEDGWTLEVDDMTVVWSHEKKFPGIMKCIRWMKSHYPRLKLNLQNIDKLDPHNYRVYVDDTCGHYENIVGLSSKSVGMIYVMVNEFHYTDNDERYGEKMYYSDGEWSK